TGSAALLSPGPSANGHSGATGLTSTDAPQFRPGKSLAISVASLRLSTSSKKKPPLASLDSANGPSATERPFFCDTLLPSGKRGLPALALPSAVKRSSQAYICFTTS